MLAYSIGGDRFAFSATSRPNLELTLNHFVHSVVLTDQQRYSRALLFQHKLFKESFFKKLVSNTKNSFHSLKFEFDAEFAAYLLNFVCFKSKAQILKFSADNLLKSRSISSELILQIATVPEHLDRAIRSILKVCYKRTYYSSPTLLLSAKGLQFNSCDYIQNRDLICALLMLPTKDQLLAADSSGLLVDLKYILCMKTLKSSQLSDNILTSLTLMKFIPFMHLTSPCHFEAFTYLNSHAKIDLKSFFEIDSRTKWSVSCDWHFYLTDFNRS